MSLDRDTALPDADILLIDDGSTDGTAALARAATWLGRRDRAVALSGTVAGSQRSS